MSRLETMSGSQQYKAGMSVEEASILTGIKPQNFIKLASNENPLGVPQKALSAAVKAASFAHKYPSPVKVEALKKELASMHGLKPENICLGNGSDDLLDMLFKTLIPTRGTVCLCKPTFTLYEIIASVYGWKTSVLPLKNGSWYDLDALEKAVARGCCVAFVCTPNNPTGGAVDMVRLERFIRDNCGRALICVDAAYSDFDSKNTYKILFDMIKEGIPFLLLQTFSKLHGMAGLRIGAGYTTPEYAQKLNYVKMPFNVNSIALEAASAALKDKAHISRTLKTVQRERGRFEKFLSGANFEYIPSCANFVLMKGRPGLFDRLMEAGIITRECSSFGLPGWLRVSIGEKTAMDRVMRVMETNSPQSSQRLRNQ